jgi:hypothetical protein
MSADARMTWGTGPERQIMKAEITTTNAQAVVRATSTEMFQLWCLYADESGWQYPIIRMENGELVRKDQRGVVAWKEQSRGEWRQIGDIAGRPICVAVAYAEINGVRVAFVEGISQLVDYKMIDEWVEREMPQTATHRADAMNWRNALHGIKVEPLPDVADLEHVTSEPPARVPAFALPAAVAGQIEALLACGGELHAFRSGGGLRVVSIRNPDGKAPADAYMWRSVQHGVATTFVEAVALALTAAPIEAQEEK